MTRSSTIERKGCFDRMMIKVGKLNIRFEAEAEALYGFLREEYGLIECADEGRADIAVRIENGKAPEDAIRLRASCRECGLKMTPSLDGFTLFLPYKPRKRDAFQLINPAFMPKWQASLTDFLHNAFLAALEIKLLENGMTLFHASAVKSGDGAKLLLGEGGSGKSTIAGLLAKRGFGTVAEDFCVIGEGRVFPLPHRARISIRKYDSFNKRTAADSLNRGVSRLLGKKPYRVLPFERIYSGSAEIGANRISGVYLLERESGPALEPMSADETARIAGGIMLEEFENMAWSKEVFSRSRYAESGLEDAIRQTAAAALAGAETARLMLPKYDDLDETADTAQRLLFGKGDDL